MAAIVARPLVIRVKRKRFQEADDELVLLPEEKVQKTIDALSALPAGPTSTAEATTETPKFIFKRFDTFHAKHNLSPTRRNQLAQKLLEHRLAATKKPITNENVLRSSEKLGKSAQQAQREALRSIADDQRAAALARRRKRLAQAQKEGDILSKHFHIVDMASAPSDSPQIATFASTATTKSAEVTAVAKCPSRIMSPVDRMMDEAIWKAFKTGTFQDLARALQTGANVNYQRSASDFTSALMAAAFHGNAEFIQLLLRKGARPMLQDVNGKTARRIAIDQSHDPAAMLLPADPDEEDDCVYDYFVLDADRDALPPTESGVTASATNTTSTPDQSTTSASVSPATTTSTAATAATSTADSPTPTAPDTRNIFRKPRELQVSEHLLQGAHAWALPSADPFYADDGSEGESDMGSEDSNREDFHTHDYPEEEEGDDDDDVEGVGGMEGDEEWDTAEHGDGYDAGFVDLDGGDDDYSGAFSRRHTSWNGLRPTNLGRGAVDRRYGDAYGLNSDGDSVGGMEHSDSAEEDGYGDSDVEDEDMHGGDGQFRSRPMEGVGEEGRRTHAGWHSARPTYPARVMGTGLFSQPTSSSQPSHAAPLSDASVAHLRGGVSAIFGASLESAPPSSLGQRVATAPKPTGFSGVVHTTAAFDPDELSD